MHKALKATISGSFLGSNKQTESYSEVIGYLPLLDDDKAAQMIIKRYAKIWISEDKNDKGEFKYNRISRVREVFIDNLEEVDADEFTFVGKDIMKMDYEELQDLAAAKDLSGIPLYKEGSLANQRRVAFAQYGGKILGLTMPKNEKGAIVQVLLDHRLDGFDPAQYAPIIVKDGSIERRDPEKLNIEESIDREALALAGKAEKPVEGREPSKLTMDQLKALADHKKIKYNAKISYTALHKLLYPEAA